MRYLVILPNETVRRFRSKPKLLRYLEAVVDKYVSIKLVAVKDD